MPNDKPLNESDVVTIARAARALHMNRSVAARWMRKHGLVVNLDGRQRVVWGSLMRVLEAEVGRQAALQNGGQAARTPKFRGMNRVRLS
jgi:hypothetical protein